MEKVLEISHLSKKFGHQYALNDVNLTIRKGDVYGLIGKNGAGKTTMVKHLNGLLKPTQGHVYVCGRDTAACSVADLAHSTAYVFQNPDHQLFNQTVEDEIAFGPRNLG